MKNNKKTANLRFIISDILIVLFVLSLLIHNIMSIVGTFYFYQVYDEIAVRLLYFSGISCFLYVIIKILTRSKFDIHDLLILLLLFLGIISTIYAIDMNVSLYGVAGRYEGLFQLVLYYMLFLNCKNIHHSFCKKILLWSIVIVALVHSIYGICQFFDIKYIFDIKILRHRFYSTGLELNPNFYGTVTLIGLNLSLTMYFVKKSKILSALTLIISSIMFLGFLCSGSMSVMVGFFFSIVFLVILFFVLKLKFIPTLIKSILLILLFTSIYIGFNKYDNGYYWFQTKRASNDIINTLQGETQDIYGSGRMYIWKETWKIVPDYLWTGAGIDNFMYAFGERPLRDYKTKLMVDKAHNEYLQKLITEGVFSLGTYLILLLILFIKSMIKLFKKNESNCDLLLPLLICFVSYCVQAFFNISIITVAPLFYIVMGLMCSCFKGDKDEKVEY